MASTSPSNPLTPEIVVRIWRAQATSKHDDACRRGADCSGPELCTAAGSPDPSVAWVCKQWRGIAKRNPGLFSFIHIKAEVGYPTAQHLISIPAYNEREVKAYIALSGSEDIHLSIGCTTSQALPTGQLALGALAARTSCLVLDTDHPRILFAITNASFSRLKTIHLIHSLQRDLYTKSSAIIEDFRLWRDSPLERIVSGHERSAVFRSKASWSAIRLLDLYGVYHGLREADVEAILHHGINLDELRVVVNARTTNLGIPNTSWFATGRHLGRLVHDRLKTLFITHIIPFRRKYKRPPHQLFKGMEFKVLENLHYSCTGYPHDNSIQWLKESRPTVKILSIDAQYISSGALHSILPAFSRLQSLRLEAQGTSGSDQDCLSFDDPTLDALRGASAELVTLFLCGEGSFTTDAMARFVEARRGSLQTFLLQEWCGPTSKQVDAVKGALSPVDLKVGRAYACETTRLRGTRAERETVVDRCDGDGKGAAPDEEFPRDGPLAYWCIPCGKNHYVEVVDAEVLDMCWPMIDDRRRVFCHGESG